MAVLLAGIGTEACGYVCVADPGNYRIQKFDSDGKFISVTKGQGEELTSPVGIAVNSSGRVTVWLIRYTVGSLYLNTNNSRH
jgi:hypothetical protein